MSVLRTLRRLRRVREIEEEQQRLVLEAALADLHTLQGATAHAVEQARNGRRRIALSVQSGDLIDRLAGREEIRIATRREEILQPLLEAASQRVSELRNAYLAVRVERRQAETLIEKVEERERQINIRRVQQDLDDWYRARGASGRIH